MTTTPSLMCSRHPNVRMVRGGNHESNRSSPSTFRPLRNTCYVCSSEKRAFREHPRSRSFANVIEEVKDFHQTPEFQILLENWRGIGTNDEEPKLRDEENSAVGATDEDHLSASACSRDRSSSSSTLSFFRDADDDIHSRTSATSLRMDLDSAAPQGHLPSQEVMADNQRSVCSFSEQVDDTNNLSLQSDDDEKERLRRENQVLQAELAKLKAMAQPQQQTSGASLHQATASGNSSCRSALLREPRDIVFVVDETELNGRASAASTPSIDSQWQQKVWAPPKTTTSSPFQGRDSTSTTKTSTLEIALEIPSLSSKVGDQTLSTHSSMARPSVPSHIYLPHHTVDGNDSVSMLGSEWDGSYPSYGTPNNNSHPSQPSPSPCVLYVGPVKPPPVLSSSSSSNRKGRHAQIIAKDLLRQGKKAFSAVTAHLIPSESGSSSRKEDETLSITSLFGNDKAHRPAAAKPPSSSNKSSQVYFPNYRPRSNTANANGTGNAHPKQQAPWLGIGGTLGMSGNDRKEGNIPIQPTTSTRLADGTATTQSFAPSMKEEDENYDEYSLSDCSSVYTP